jgi:hypothetical protein
MIGDYLVECECSDCEKQELKLAAKWMGLFIGALVGTVALVTLLAFITTYFAGDCNVHH